MKFSTETSTFHKYNYKNKPFISKLLEFIIFFSIFLFFAGVLYQFISTEMDLGKYKINGRMISIGSYRVMINTGGSGDYSVVFESDIGTPIQQWNGVREGLENDFRLFSYSRAGYGWSDSADEDVTIGKSVNNLRKVLIRSGVSSPYILIGHGYGGLIMTEYAQKYPEEVMGVVLIDSLMEQDIKSKEYQNKLSMQSSKYKIARIASFAGGMRLLYKLNLMENNEAFLNNLTDVEKGLFMSQRVTPKYNLAYYNELKNLENYMANIQQPGALSNKPLIVVTPANKYKDEKLDNSYIEAQKKLVDMSSKGEQMLVERSSSYIQVDRPDAVINAVNNIVKKASRE